MPAKFYSVLKSSYQDNHECFMSNMLFGQATDMQGLEAILKGIIKAIDVKRVFISSKAHDSNLFYIEYDEDYEKEFYHGFAVQIFDFSNGRQYKVTEKTSKEEYDSIIEYLKLII